MDTRKDTRDEFQDRMPRHLAERILEEARQGRKFSGPAVPHEGNVPNR